MATPAPDGLQGQHLDPEPYNDTGNPVAENQDDSLSNNGSNEESHSVDDPKLGDDDDGGLFVAQPGEVREIGGVIDLTQDTDEDCQARLHRINAGVAAGITVKQEQAGHNSSLANIPTASDARNQGTRPDFRGHDLTGDADNDSDFQVDEDDQVSDEERPRKRQRRSKPTKEKKHGSHTPADSSRDEAD